MRKLLLFIPLAAIIYYSCSTTPARSTLNLLNTDSLPTQNFIINVNADTLLHTMNGTWLKIDKGTFSSDNGKVALEIKEALTMQQIIKAGLVTQSNGQPLASGGMIYINAAAGQKVTINKPFKVAVPSASLDKNMQLFKGEKNADGNINWKDPKAVDDNLQMSALKKGEILFQQKCASCHGIGKEGSGPDLANLYKRFGREMGGEGSLGNFEHFFKKIYWYTSKIQTYQRGKLIAQRDTLEYSISKYDCNLISLYNNKEVDLQDDFIKNTMDWRMIYDYIENESNLRKLPYPRHAYLDSCIDSCNLYKYRKTQLEIKMAKTEEERHRLIRENHSMARTRTEPILPQNNNAPPPGFINDTTSAEKNTKVTPQDYTATYYEFTIETFGWYNIDMLLKQDDNIKQSELFVRIVGAYRGKIKVYLIIPDIKVLLEGGPTEKNKDEYAFYEKDGYIPLPQNMKAYIMSITETEKSIAYSLKEFTPQIKQSFEISLNESSKEQFNAAIENIANDLKVSVNNSKNSAAIKEVDKANQQLQEELKNVEKLKPTRCDCDCGQQSATKPTDTSKYEDDYNTDNIMNGEIIPDKKVIE